MWDPQWAELTAAHRTIRCDLRGFGQTPLGGERYSDANDVRALLDALRIERAALVGSSMGGRVALEVATAYPGRVYCLVLLCPAFRGLPPSATLRRFDEEEAALLRASDVEGAIEHNIRTWVGPEADHRSRELVRRGLRRAFEVQLDAEHPPDKYSPDVDLARIDVPTLVVSGGHDLDHFKTIAEHLVRRLPRARHLILPWAGHLPSLERPPEVTALVTDFLAHRSASS
jgi:pimeloyl-ACP methyl ester carboxylesterase